MQTSTRQASGSGLVLSATSALLDRRQIGLPCGPTVQLPYVRQSSAERRELNGAAIYCTSRQTEIDEYGNPTGSTQSVTAAGQSVTSSH